MKTKILILDQEKPAVLAVIEVAPNGLWGVKFPTLGEQSYLGFVEPAEAVRYADRVLAEEGL